MPKCLYAYNQIGVYFNLPKIIHRIDIIKITFVSSNLYYVITLYSKPLI